MDDEAKRCQKMVIAIMIQNMKDMTSPYGVLNNRLACRQAFDFIFNPHTSEYENFCFWCDLACLNKEYWHQIAIMNLAQELLLKPWLRYRILLYMKGEKNMRDLRCCYEKCKQNGYHNYIEVLENEYID
ncbi:MAG: hypothetical protein IJ660_05595 [Alphaproteobacteria bacterium]|nr:hypothetical protein [Alphaproteobacteria bacterium]